MKDEVNSYLISQKIAKLRRAKINDHSAISAILEKSYIRTLRIYLLGLGLIVREMGGLIRRDVLVVVNLVVKCVTL